MIDKKPREYKLLKEEDARDWINLVVKVNQGYELDEKEIEKIGFGFMAIDAKNVPENRKVMIRKAENYYKLNRTEK